MAASANPPPKPESGLRQIFQGTVVGQPSLRYELIRILTKGLLIPRDRKMICENNRAGRNPIAHVCIFNIGGMGDTRNNDRSPTKGLVDFTSGQLRCSGLLNNMFMKGHRKPQEPTDGIDIHKLFTVLKLR